jgi:hypothetical protein
MIIYIQFQSGKRNKKQTNAISQDKNMKEKRKIMLVIASKLDKKAIL